MNIGALLTIVGTIIFLISLFIAIFDLGFYAWEIGVTGSIIGLVLLVIGGVCISVEKTPHAEFVETYCTCNDTPVKYCEKCGNIIIEEVNHEPT